MPRIVKDGRKKPKIVNQYIRPDYKDRMPVAREIKKRTGRTKI